MDELLFKGLGSTANKKVPSVRRNRSDNCELAESQSSSRRRWPSYGENDVLVGRGRGCTSHSGNKRYLDIVESYMISYTRAKGREEQRHIKMSILDAVRGAGGRFLKPVKGSKEHSWEELSLTAVLDKIAQSIRHQIRQGKSSSELEPEPIPRKMHAAPDPTSVSTNPFLQTQDQQRGFYDMRTAPLHLPRFTPAESFNAPMQFPRNAVPLASSATVYEPRLSNDDFWLNVTSLENKHDDGPHNVYQFNEQL